VLDTLILNLLGCFLGALFIAGFVLDQWFDKVLRREHPQVWQALGSPTFARRSLRTQLACTRFLWRSEYLRLRNRKLTLLARFEKLVVIAFSVGFVAMLLLYPELARGERIKLW